MANASDRIFDDIVGHSLDVLRLAEDVRRTLLRDLEKLETDLVKDLEDAVGKTNFTLARLRALLTQTRQTISTAYSGIASDTQEAMERLARLIASQTQSSVASAVGVNLLSVAMSPAQLEAVARNTVVFGKFPWEWWKDQDVKLRERFAQAMRLGQYRGETVDQLVRRVRGTKAAKYTDGIMNATRRQAEALVRTSVIAVSNEARLSTYDKNRDVIKGVQWVSTLDDRTTLTCVALDGLQWEFPESGTDYADYEPVGHDKEFPGPTAHWNCRSTQVPITYSWEELSGRVGTAARAKRIPKGTRASVDGQVARAKKFGDWLTGQSEDRQDDILGKGKAELFRAGKIGAIDLTDVRNRPLTLKELESRHG